VNKAIKKIDVAMKRIEKNILKSKKTISALWELRDIEIKKFNLSCEEWAKTQPLEFRPIPGKLLHRRGDISYGCVHSSHTCNCESSYVQDVYAKDSYQLYHKNKPIGPIKNFNELCMDDKDIRELYIKSLKRTK